MYKIFKILIVGLLLFITTDAELVLSQDAGGAAAPAPAAPAPVAPGGGALTAPLQFPEYVVTPKEDLNQFENSKVRKTTTEYREGSSTIGRSHTKKSNAEINAEIERRRAEREEAESQEAGIDAEVTEPDAVTEDYSGDLNVTGKSKLFKWKDKDGILHVTDDPSAVPPEYKDQVLNSN